MKKSFVLLCLIAFVSFNVSAQEDFKTEKEKFSYALGVLISQNFRGQPLPDIDPAVFGTGFSDITNGKTPKLDAQTASTFVNEYMTAYQAKQAEKDAAKFAGNKEAGIKFLAENATKEGVKTTASGLQYMVIREGDGPSPVATDKVTVHYEGTLTSGEVFDSSYKRGEPIDFPLNGVIKGWTEGVQLMKTGAKYRFFIPQELAYGSRATGALIKPYSTLVFDVELLSIAGK